MGQIQIDWSQIQQQWTGNCFIIAKIKIDQWRTSNSSEVKWGQLRQYGGTYEPEHSTGQ